jgi:hypothetical protein
MSSKFFGNSKDNKTNNKKDNKSKGKNRAPQAKNTGIRKVGRGK